MSGYDYKLLGNTAAIEIQNSKPEIRNKAKNPKPQGSKPARLPVLGISPWDFAFVSSFGFRAPDFYSNPPADTFDAFAFGFNQNPPFTPLAFWSIVPPNAGNHAEPVTSRAADSRRRRPLSHSAYATLGLHCALSSIRQLRGSPLFGNRFRTLTRPNSTAPFFNSHTIF